MAFRSKLFAFVLFCLAASTLKARAQTYVYTKNRPAADKVVAIIGNEIILQSDVELQLVQLQRTQDSLPPDAECSVLEQLLAQKALVLQAQLDSLPVSDDDVESTLEQRIRYFEAQYGSQAKMEQVLGMSIYQIKDQFRPGIKESMLAQAEQQKIFNDVKITPTEVEQFYKSIPADSLPYLESQVEVGQIVINPKPSPDIVQLTISQLNEFRNEVLKEHKSFEVLANLYSNDRATAGSILTVDRTQHTFDPDFVAAAFRLKNGEISPVIHTQFGYHIIQMVSREGNIAKVRHILLKPPTTTEDLARASRKLDSIRQEILSGKLTWGEASTQYSDDDNYFSGTKKSGGMFTMPDGSTFMSMDQLDKGLVLMLDTLKVGEISAPVSFTPDPRSPDSKSERIVYLKSRSKPHRLNLKDDYSKIEAEALQQKQYKTLNDWLDNHIGSFYLKVDPSFDHCKDIARWVKASEKQSHEGL